MIYLIVLLRACYSDYIKAIFHVGSHQAKINLRRTTQFNPLAAIDSLNRVYSLVITRLHLYKHDSIALLGYYIDLQMPMLRAPVAFANHITVLYKEIDSCLLGKLPPLF